MFFFADAFQPFWLFFRRTLSPAEIAEKITALESEKTVSRRIRCPLCGWNPCKSDLWSCVSCDYPEFYYDGCYTSWNTFETRGRCPGCAHQWRWTSCLRCYGWSLHKDWYEEEND